jgi:membrane associated rhomboid family serine protease
MLPVGTNLRLKKIPLATFSLLFANWVIFMFLRWDYCGTHFWVRRYLFSVPGEQYPWQLVTSMFLHDGIRHITGNSLFLWVFGVFVEDKVGWKAYLFLYFLTGIAAGLVQGMMTGVFAREELFIPSLGASGAISGIMGVYLYRCYYSKVKLLISLWLPIRVQIPAVAIIGFWFLKDVLGGINSLRGISTNIGFWAHVGGLLAGVGASKYLSYGIEARREKTEFVAETKTDLLMGYGEGIEACEKLIENDPENPELHLKLARAKSRWRASQEATQHYQRAIKRLLEADPRKAVEVFLEYWQKYLTVMEPRHQVSLSRLINKYVDTDFSAKTLHALIDSDHSRDVYMEQAFLDLARLYHQLEKDGLARYVYTRFLQEFPESKHRQFAEEKLNPRASGLGSNAT